MLTHPQPSASPAAPVYRHLRGYALDPSLAQALDTATISAITLELPWERLAPGPVDTYLEVIDYDPSTRCFYSPVDLDEPNLLAQDGLAPSEPNEDTLETVVRAGSTIGAGALVGPGLEIGAYAMVGMGAVVTGDVPAHGLVFGAPARLRGWVCVCGSPLAGVDPPETLRCGRCHRAYDVLRRPAGPIVVCRD